MSESADPEQMTRALTRQLRRLLDFTPRRARFVAEDLIDAGWTLPTEPPDTSAKYLVIAQELTRTAARLVHLAETMQRTEEATNPPEGLVECSQCGVASPGRLVDPAPAREHILALGAHYPLSKLAKLMGVRHAVLYDLAAGKKQRLFRHSADVILSTTVEHAHALYAPELDWVVLERIMQGHRPKVPTKDKPVYARALRERGWMTSAIAKTLSMSGVAVNRALQPPSEMTA